MNDKIAILDDGLKQLGYDQHLTWVETLGAVASTSLLSMLASEEDSQIKGFCSMSRERWMSTDADPALTTAIRELRKGLLEVEKAK